MKINNKMLIFGIVMYLAVLILIIGSFTNAQQISKTKINDLSNKKITIQDTNNSLNAQFSLLWNSANCGGDQPCEALIKSIIINPSVFPLNNLSFIDTKSSNKKRINITNYSIIAYTFDKNGKIKDATDKDNEIYYKISANKKINESLDWIINLYGFDILEWDIWGEQLIYDDFNSIYNTSLWTNSTNGTYCGSECQSSIGVNSGKLFVSSKVTGSCSAGDVARTWAQSTNFPTYTSISNITLSSIFTITDARASTGGTRLKLFGNTLKAGYDSGTNVWTILRNNSLSNSFTVYKDGIYNATISASDSIVRIESDCDDSGNGDCCDMSTQLDYVYYVLRGPINISLVSPQNNSWVKNPVIFNLSALATGNLANISLFGNFTGTFKFNQSVNINGSSNSTNFTLNLSEGQYIWNGLASDDLGNINFSQFNYTIKVDNTKPSISINSPANIESTILINVSINSSDSLSGLNYCYFNITRGASIEVPNTQITNCLSIITSVSGDATYNIYVWSNDSAGNFNNTNKSFIVNAGIVIPPTISGGGGGGGGTIKIIQQLTSPIKTSLCDATITPFNDALDNFFKKQNLENFKILWYSYWNYSLCKNAASFIPTEV